MKMQPELCDAFCQKAVEELRNFYIYIQMYNYFENLQLKNLAKHFKSQADEEKGHFDKIIAHMNDRIGCVVKLPEVDQPILDIKSVETIASVYLETEQQTTESFEELYGLALDLRSYIDLPFLSEMLNLQVFEESEALELGTKLRLVKDLVLFDSVFEA